MAAGTANQTYNLYRSVIDEVIKNVKDAFHNEGHDEKVIQELRNAWEHRLKDSEAVKMSKSDINIPDTSSAIYPHNTITKSHQTSHLQMPSSSGSLVGNFRSGGDERVRELEVHPQPGSLYRMSTVLNAVNTSCGSCPTRSGTLSSSGPIYLSNSTSFWIGNFFKLHMG